MNVKYTTFPTVSLAASPASLLVGMAYLATQGQLLQRITKTCYRIGLNKINLFVQLWKIKV